MGGLGATDWVGKNYYTKGLFKHGATGFISQKFILGWTVFVQPALPCWAHEN
jgi:hypothetical protein